MRRTRFDDWPCPIARTTDLVGDWWTPLVMRQAFLGARRFEDFAEQLDVPRATLSQRLDRLVDEGMLRRARYQERPVRHEYRLTEKGRAFWGVLAAMWRFGDDWLWADGEDGAGAGDPARRDVEGPAPGSPIELVDRETGERVDPVVVDEHTGRVLDVRRLLVRPSTT